MALAGTLKIVHAYGPPGYGEDKKVDIPVSYWALDLSFRVTVACTPDLPELKSIECGSTNRLRLFFPVEPEANGLEKKARTLLGRKTIVTGILHRRESMADYTPVYMNVTDIAGVPPQEPRKSHP